MTNTEYVVKSQLITFIGQVIQKQETGLVSILTDGNRSVLLKFSNGKLIDTYCRSRDVGEIIRVLNESRRVKFSIVPIAAEAGLEIMPGESFLQLLSTGIDAEPPPGEADSLGSDITERHTQAGSTQGLLEKLAAEYLGLVAEIIVEEALQSCTNLESAIEYIANSIPNQTQATAFQAEAKKVTQLIRL